MVPLLDADILLVEGGKAIGWLPRILCLRTTPELLTALPEGCKALRPELALATYGDNTLSGLPSFTAEDLDALADLIVERAFLLPGLDCGACGEGDCAADAPYRGRGTDPGRLRSVPRSRRGDAQRAGHRLESLYRADAFRRDQGNAWCAQGHGSGRRGGDQTEG
ncbi:MAG: hypothetical protein V8Q84_02535 [Bilophila sp.]